MQRNKRNSDEEQRSNVIERNYILPEIKYCEHYIYLILVFLRIKRKSLGSIHLILVQSLASFQKTDFSDPKFNLYFINKICSNVPPETARTSVFYIDYNV